MKISIMSLLLAFAVVSLPLAGVFNRYSGMIKIRNFLKECNAEILWLDATAQDKIRSKKQTKWNSTKEESLVDRAMRKLIGDDGPAYIKNIQVTLNTPERIDKANQLFRKSASLRGLERMILRIEDPDERFDARFLSGLDDVRLLSLQGTKLTARDFQAIAGMEDLEILWLGSAESFSLEDAAILSRLDHLTWLSIPGHWASDSEIEKLREQLPGVYVTPTDY